LQFEIDYANEKWMACSVSAFEYIAGFMTIVLGLSVARALGGIGAFITADQRSLNDWTTAGFCLTLALLQIGWWSVLWGALGESEVMSKWQVFSWIAATAMLFLAGHVLVPNEGSSPKTPSWPIRPGFFICMGLHFSAVPLSILFEVRESLSLVIWPALMIILCLIGLFFRSDKARAALAIGWLSLSFFAVLYDPTAPFLR
jgi:hypothetical protein